MHIYQSDQKLWTFCHIYPDVFKYFQFFADVSIVLYPLLQLFYFYYIMLYSVCLLSEKKRSASRVLIHDCIYLPNLHISKKFHVPAIFPLTSSKNWWRHREYTCIIRTQLYRSYPVQSFMSLAVLKQKLRYGGGGKFPPTPHPKMRFRKPTGNRVKAKDDICQNYPPNYNG